MDNQIKSNAAVVEAGAHSIGFSGLLAALLRLVRKDANVAADAIWDYSEAASKGDYSSYKGLL